MIALLVAALLSLPDQSLTPAEARANVDAAIAAEAPGIDAPLLVALAWRETRFVRDTVAGRYRFCGVAQTAAHGNVARCLAMQDLGVGYALGARELSYWLERRHGNLAAALASHACGNTITRACRVYAGGVLSMAARLRAAVWGVA